jgi:ABC-type sugar transport system ATPase subunit
MVEIAKALSFRAKVLVMDEPTSTLTDEETDRLFSIIRSLQGQGIAVVYISHRIKEVFEIADRVTVLRDGKVVGTEMIRNVDETALVKMMIGRTLDTIFPEKGEQGGEVVLSARHLSRKGAFDDISFDLQKGEILGLSGLVGSGRTEVARTLFGADRMDRGEILLDGRAVKIRSPRDAVSFGLGLVPENRREEGLVICLSVQKNTVLAVLERMGRFLFRNPRRERDITVQLVSSLDIKCPSCDCEVGLLSGGNQQKVVLSKWLSAPPKVIMFDEPTRGIDVGAKAEIHILMRTLANKGAGILMISSELPEVLGMSDRILVMREGRLVGDFSAQEATEQKVMAAATGVMQ